MIKDELNKIRKPRQETKENTVIMAVIAFLFGTALGLLSKWLDNLALDSTIWWHRVFERLDLGNFFSDIAIWLLIAFIIAVFSASAMRSAVNVFVFFAGMCAAYHLYTILFCGFNPSSYMMIWYLITLLSPLLAALCWYAKGYGAVALMIDIGIIAVFTLSCFSTGFFYVDLKGILYLLVYVSAVAVLYRSPKQLFIALPIGFLLSFLISPIWPFR